MRRLRDTVTIRVPFHIHIPIPGLTAIQAPGVLPSTRPEAVPTAAVPDNPEHPVQEPAPEVTAEVSPPDPVREHPPGENRSTVRDRPDSPPALLAHILPRGLRPTRPVHLT